MNTDTSVITVNSDTVTEVSTKIENALTIMAEKLGVASDHFYPIVVEQQVIQGWIYIWTAIPLFIIASILFIIGFSELKARSEGAGWAFFIGLIFYGVFVAVIGTNLAQILNPEYYALMEIKGFIQ